MTTDSVWRKVKFGKRFSFAAAVSLALIPQVVWGQTAASSIATTYPGADVGAQINAAIEAQPGNDVPGSRGCGVVQLPSGYYLFRTTIVKPRCTFLDLNGSTLMYTGSTVAVVIGDALPPAHYISGGIRNGAILGGEVAISRAIGIYLGGDPAATISPSGYFAFGQSFTDLVVQNFTDGFKFGNNSYSNAWQGGAIALNTNGFHFVSGVGNSGENLNLHGVVFDNNASHDILADSGSFAEVNAEGASFDYAAGASIAGPIMLSSSDSHFERAPGHPFFDCSGGGCSLDIKGGSMYLLGAVTPADVFGKFAGSNNIAIFDGVEYGVLPGQSLSQFNTWNDSSALSSLRLVNFRQAIGVGLSAAPLTGVPLYAGTSNPSAVLNRTRQSATVNGKSVCLTDGTNCPAPGTQSAPTAPSGSCTTRGAWVLSADGHATYCNGSSWVSKL